MTAVTQEDRVVVCRDGLCHTRIRNVGWVGERVSWWEVQWEGRDKVQQRAESRRQMVLLKRSENRDVLLADSWYETCQAGDS